MTGVVCYPTVSLARYGRLSLRVSSFVLLTFAPSRQGYRARQQHATT